MLKVDRAAIARLWRAMAVHRLDADDPAGAEQALRQAIELDPDYAAAHLALGQLYLAQGRLDAAERAFREAADLAPSLAAAHAGLRAVYVARGDSRRAQQAALTARKAAVTADPHDPDAWRELGLAYLEAGRTDEARTALRQALALDPADASAWRALGDLSLAGGELAEARSAYLQALRDQPDMPDVYAGLAAWHAANGSWVDALAWRELAASLMLTITRSYELPMASSPASDPAALLRSLGESYLAVGDAEAAVVALEQAANLNPDDLETRRALARAYLAAGRIQDALVSYDLLTALRPDSSEGFVAQGDANLALERFPQAEAAYRRALDINPGDDWARLGLADALRAQGEDEAAAALYENVQSTASAGSVAALIAEARLTEAAGDDVMATKNYLDVLEIADHQPLLAALWRGLRRTMPAYLAFRADPMAARVAALLAKGDQARSAGDLEAALAFYEQAVSLDPASEQARDAAGGLRVALAQTAQAAYQDALQTGDQAAAMHHQGDLRRYQRDEAGAAQAYRAALALGDDAPETWARLGEMLSATDDTSGARRAFREALAREADNVIALQGLCRVQLAIEAWVDATPTCQQWAELRPEDTEAALVLGQAYAGVGQYDQAIQTLERALTLDPSLTEARIALADALWSAGRKDDAWQQYVRAYRENRSDVRAQIALSQAYLADGRPYRAVALLEQTVSEGEQSLDLLVALGKAYAQTGRMVQARERYQQVLDRKPGFGPALAALAELALNDGNPEAALALCRRALTAGVPGADVAPTVDAALAALVDLTEDRRTAAIRQRLGDRYRDQGDVRRAWDEYQAALEADQTVQETYLQAWTAQKLLHRDSQAKATLTAWVSYEHERESRAKAWELGVGNWGLGIGNAEFGIWDLRTAVRYRQAGDLAADRGDLSLALRLYDLALQHDPTDTIGWDKVAAAADVLFASQPNANLLDDPGFEKGPTGGDWEALNGQPFARRIAAPQTRSGDWGGWLGGAQPSAPAALCQTRSLTPGATYLLAGDIRRPSPPLSGRDGGGQVGYREYWLGDRWVPSLGVPLPDGTGWQRARVTFTVPPEARKTRLCLARLTDEGALWLDNWMLVRLPITATHPLDVALYHRLGELYAADEQWDKAATAYAQAATQVSEDQDAWRGLAQALVRYRQAVNDYQAFPPEVTELSSNALLYDYLGDAYAAAGLWDQAVAALQQATRLDPDAASGRRPYALALDAVLAQADASGEPLFPNLLDNPGFEDRRAGWRVYDPSASATFTTDTSNARQGQRSGLIRSNQGGYHGGYFQFHRLKPGHTYLYAFDLKVRDDGGLKGRLLYWDYKRGGRIVGDWAAPFAGTQDWTREAWFFTVPGGVRGVSLYPVLVGGRGRVWLDDVRLVELPPEWQPPVGESRNQLGESANQ